MLVLLFWWVKLWTALTFSYCFCLKVVISPGHGKRDQNKHHKQIAKPLQNSTQSIFTSQQGNSAS